MLLFHLTLIIVHLHDKRLGLIPSPCIIHPPGLPKGLPGGRMGVLNLKIWGFTNNSGWAGLKGSKQ